MSETIEQKCIAKGVKLTDQRKIIAKIMSESQDHPDVDELYKRASAIDGKISIGENSQSLKERINISYNGFLEITIIVNKAGSLVNNPIISHKGIPSNEENDNFVYDLSDKVRSICKTYSLNNHKHEQNLIDALKTNCRKTVKDKTGKRPYTNINLVRI